MEYEGSIDTREYKSLSVSKIPKIEGGGGMLVSPSISHSEGTDSILWEGL